MIKHDQKTEAEKIARLRDALEKSVCPVEQHLFLRLLVAELEARHERILVWVLF